MSQGMAPDRARVWIDCLASSPPAAAFGVDSVLSANVMLSDGDSQRAAVAIAVVQDPRSRLPRARSGELGLEQAAALAACVHQCITDDRNDVHRPIIAIVDTAGQALGRIEEQRCISAACAACIEAYDAARRAGHSVLTLVVGRALSGAFLAHGMQSDTILALAGNDVMMHAMSRQSIARVMRRSKTEVEALTASVLPMSYAIEDAHRLGIIHRLIPDICADAPTPPDKDAVLRELLLSLASPPVSLENNATREATITVRRLMREQWMTATVNGGAH